MDYTPYYETMRRTSLLRGMTDAELDTLMACFAPRVRRYAKGELLLMAGYETHEVGLVLEGAITASKPLADGSTVVMARMGPGGVFADVLAGGRSRSPVNVSAAEACLALYLPCEALLRPCAALHSAHLKLLQNWLETISDKYFALDPPFGADLLQEPARAHLHVAAGTARAVRRGYVFHRHDPH